MPIYVNGSARKKKALRLALACRALPLSYCASCQEPRARSQIYTQICRVAFRKIKRLSFSLFSCPGSPRGSYNDDGQAIIARRRAGPKNRSTIRCNICSRDRIDVRGGGGRGKKKTDSCGPQVVCMKLRSRRCRIYERKCTVCYPTERDRLVIPFVR